MQKHAEANTLKKSPFVNYVRKYLLAEGVQCGRHCKEPVHFETLFEDEKSLVGAYVCPSGNVSRVVYFTERPDAKWFETFLSEQAGRERIRSKDIRFATRYGWELGKSAEDEIHSVTASGSIKEYYWTFYPQSEDDKKSGTFFCQKEKGGCGKLFTQTIVGKDNSLCPSCSAK